VGWVCLLLLCVPFCDCYMLSLSVFKIVRNWASRSYVLGGLIWLVKSLTLLFRKFYLIFYGAYRLVYFTVPSTFLPLMNIFCPSSSSGGAVSIFPHVTVFPPFSSSLGRGGVLFPVHFFHFIFHLYDRAYSISCVVATF